MLTFFDQIIFGLKKVKNKIIRNRRQIKLIDRRLCLLVLIPFLTWNIFKIEIEKKIIFVVKNLIRPKI